LGVAGLLGLARRRNRRTLAGCAELPWGVEVSDEFTFRWRVWPAPLEQPLYLIIDESWPSVIVDRDPGDEQADE
jgi:hypothetical protein